jgi:hypothetical protein
MIPVLQWILVHAVTVMALAVGYGEFLIGVSLLIGLLSRVASLFGCVLMLAMCLSGGYPGPHAAFWMYWGASLNWSVFAICFAVLAVGHPEEVASVRRMISSGRRSVSRSVSRSVYRSRQRRNALATRVPIFFSASTRMFSMLRRTWRQKRCVGGWRAVFRRLLPLMELISLGLSVNWLPYWLPQQKARLN